MLNNDIHDKDNTQLLTLVYHKVYFKHIIWLHINILHEEILTGFFPWKEYHYNSTIRKIMSCEILSGST